VHFIGRLKNPSIEIGIHSFFSRRATLTLLILTDGGETMIDPQSQEHAPLNATSAASQKLEMDADRRLDVCNVFRTLVRDEVRTGRLSPLRRRRLVRYAAHLGISPRELGDLVSRFKSEGAADRFALDGPTEAEGFVKMGFAFIPGQKANRRRSVGFKILALAAALLLGFWVVWFSQ
jgi:hypothetical protein